MSNDAHFQRLSSKIQSLIDNAFYKASFLNRNNHTVAGGSQLEDVLIDMDGGFLPPSPSQSAIVFEGGHEFEFEGGERPSSILLSRIPHALQLLDLPPDDEEVLAVFRNAATGWGDNYSSEENDATDEYVSLRDWRAVCAALMDSGGDEDGAEEGSGLEVDVHENTDIIDEDLSSEPEQSIGESSDEYPYTGASARLPKRPRKSTATSVAVPRATRKARSRKTPSVAAQRRSPLSPSTSAGISPRQRRSCLQTFLLFFPGVPEEVAKRSRLGVRELNAAATVLNEKIKTEEMIEMLQAFSASPDKTMSLSDFEKMMIATQLA